MWSVWPAVFLPTVAGARLGDSGLNASCHTCAFWESAQGKGGLGSTPWVCGTAPQHTRHPWRTQRIHQLNICWVPVSGLNETEAEKGVCWHDRAW